MEKESDHPKKHHSPLHDHELERDEVREVLEFLRRNGSSIALALAIGVVAAIGIIFYRNSQSQRSEAAFKALESARTPEALKALAEDFAGTPAEQIALLEFANGLYQSGDFMESLKAYQSFLDKFPGHGMTAMVEISMAICQEAAGNLAEALGTVEKFINKNPDHFLLPQALFTKARCLAGLGRLSDAKTVYEDFIVANPESDWLPQAESELMTIDRLIRAQALQDS